MSLPHSYNNIMFGQQDVRPMLPLPMVYEYVPEIPTNWEYKVLTIDTREMDLPNVVTLNELGDQGWLLTSVLDQGTSHGGTFVNYYFVRQKKA